MTTFAATAAVFDLGDHAQSCARLKRIARLMDSALTIPGTRIVDTKENRAVLTRVEEYRVAMEQRDAPRLLTMAHPNYIDDPEPIVAALKEKGLFGIETYYKDYGPDLIDKMYRLAQKYDLVPMGGSDFHGLERSNEKSPGNIPYPDEAIDRFLARGDAILAARAARS